jgi:hypothetical protein
MEIHMTRSFAVAVGAVALLAAGMPLAQDTKAPASKPGVTATQSKPSMSMSSEMGQMDEHMKKMQALHDRMMSAATPEERQKAMEEQRKEMQSGMAMMNQMMPGGAMRGEMGRRMMGPQGEPADANAKMQMMQKRMDMMQMMMQTLMDQQGMMAGVRSTGTAPK